MLRRIIILGCLFFALVQAAPAELSELGINPLLLEFGSRPLGMGGAFGALSDVHSVLYNPGGLAWAKGVSLTVQDSQNITALQAYPTGRNSALGLAVIKKVIEDVPFQITGVANSESNVVVLSYGSKLSFIPALYRQPWFKRVGVGISVKGLAGQTLQRSGFIDRSGTGWDYLCKIFFRQIPWGGAC
jgi:hypothetical protein